MNEIEETIKDRHEKYGDFIEFSNKWYAIKDAVLHEGKGFRLDSYQGFALEMIILKIARIVNGDPNLVDNWHDIAGYARLVEIELTKEDTK